MTPAEPDRSWVRRTDVVLRPDPARVVARLFLPGQEMGANGRSRSSAVLTRVLALTDDEVATELASVRAEFSSRHHDLDALWAANAALVEHRLDDPASLSDDRRALVGAYFTSEYAVQGAALFNPSMVVHPDQDGLAPGMTRFVMSIRVVGEGHVSSVEMRTGTVDADDTVTLDPPPSYAVLAHPVATSWSRAAFRNQLRDMWGERTNSDFVLDELPERFGRDELDAALLGLREQKLTRTAITRTLEQFEWIAGCSYAVEFAEGSSLQERVLMPRAPSESNGIEDVRLVRLPGDDAHAGYVGTYTAYDGSRVSTQILATQDFRRFTVRRLSGHGSLNKGLALFPRRVGGRYLALSRADRESNGITASDDLQHWEDPTLIQVPARPWETVQLGNCGPPIETEAGWLVLTHGVGPMRQYALGALLLDLDDPTVVLGSLEHPLLRPDDDERSGYVPNVVYSCGAMLHGRTLVLPYGCSDSATRIALVSLDPLLTELSSSSLPAGPVPAAS